jgi:hypothetical protein
VKRDSLHKVLCVHGQLKTAIVIFPILTALCSCGSGTPDNKKITAADDTARVETNEGRDVRMENLTLSVPDTIKRSKSYVFSNPQAEDLFLLTIEPGPVKDSKSKLQIITSDRKVIYTQEFHTFYFVKWIYEPDTVPETGGQEAYVNYMENYWRSITPKQYEAYFKKSVNGFFDAIYPIDGKVSATLHAFDEDIDEREFLKEALTDTTIRLIDITCFDCDEGGETIGYSRKQNKVVSLIEHD